MDWLFVLGSAVLCGLAGATLLPTAIFFAQTWFAREPSANAEEMPGVRPTVAILMPAHDEALGIAHSIESARSELRPGDRLLVVADNCSDETAQVATMAGAEVVERRDSTQRGKGFALDFGVRRLAEAPPEVVVVLDADCTIRPGALNRLATLCASTSRPVQALYLMHAAPQTPLKGRIAAFAWIVKNQVRPLGGRRLGMPCQLMGTGMAFPWKLIESAPLASGHVVEDMELGLELALAGSPPLFCGEAQVDSTFPSQAEGVASQRKRWEHGHLGIIVTRAPRFFLAAIRRARPDAFLLGLDLIVPPLAFLVLILGANWLAAALFFGFFQGSLPLILATGSLALLLLGVAAAWARFGRRVISGTDLVGVPFYVFAKLPMYLRLLGNKQVEWVRTKRDQRP